MRLTVKTGVKQIEKEALFEAYKREEVLSYCKRCSNYGKNFTCPDFGFDAIEYLETYNYATVIVTEVDTRPIQEQMDKLDRDSFSSRVLDNYMKDKPGEELDFTSIIAMYAFDDIKDQMTDKLIEMEKTVYEAVSLTPGSCTKCVTCMKQHGKECICPETLRYSLESLGFKVSDIYKECFGLELGWAKGTLPSAFYSCSVLMTREEMNESTVSAMLNGMVLKIGV